MAKKIWSGKEHPFLPLFFLLPPFFFSLTRLNFDRFLSLAGEKIGVFLARKPKSAAAEGVLGSDLGGGPPWLIKKDSFSFFFHAGTSCVSGVNLIFSGLSRETWGEGRRRIGAIFSSLFSMVGHKRARHELVILPPPPPVRPQPPWYVVVMGEKGQARKGIHREFAKKHIE